MLKKPKEVETSVKTPKITKLKKIYGRLKQWKWKKNFTASIRTIGSMETVGTRENGKTSIRTLMKVAKYLQELKELQDLQKL